MQNQRVENLARRAERGDRQALERLYDLYSPDLYGFLADLTRNAALGEDLLHELWIRVMDTLPARKTPFRPWVFKIARNLAIDAWREQRTRIRREKSARTGDLNTQTAPANTGPENLRNAIDQLPREQREVVILRFYSGLSFQEMATIIGCPMQTAASRLRKALASLGGELSCARL